MWQKIFTKIYTFCLYLDIHKAIRRCGELWLQVVERKIQFQNYKWTREGLLPYMSN